MAIELEDSRGMMAYQENVMTISREVAGYSRGQADGFRKVISKKKISEIKKQYDIFVYGHEYALEHTEKLLAQYPTAKKEHDEEGNEGFLAYDHHADRDIFFTKSELEGRKKDIKKDMKLNVIKGMVGMGYTKDFADNLFRQIEAFGGLKLPKVFTIYSPARRGIPCVNSLNCWKALEPNTLQRDWKR